MEGKAIKSSFGIGLLVTAVLSIIVGCNESTLDNANESKTEQASSPYPISAVVDLFEVTPLTYPITTTLSGRVMASEIAEIRPQVSGIILKREFEEGSNVKEGDSLYQIDPAIYQAQYDSAVANVESAEASAKIAHLTLERYEKLSKTKAISQEDFDKAAADAKQADAKVLVAEANRHTAKVNLDYTKVYAPISGYIGISNVTEGALVSATSQQTPLAVVQKIDPIYIDMTQAATVFEKENSDANTLYTPANKVYLYFNDGTRYQHEGKIKFSDKSVNPTTGTVTLRAVFPNPEGRILPNMFVKPVYNYGTIENAMIVPQEAVTIAPNGEYTVVVATPFKEEKDVYVLSEKVVTVFKGIPGYWVITQGLNSGDQVVTAGLMNLMGVNLNNPEKKVYVKARKQTTLTQSQLDTIGA